MGRSQARAERAVHPGRNFSAGFFRFRAENFLSVENGIPRSGPRPFADGKIFQTEPNGFFLLSDRVK
jgi:hypothetical protein